MKKVTLKCEVVTPMFIAGANSCVPEIRGPSLKGVMRFWWRALNGNLSFKDLNLLKTEEAKIFGSSEKYGKSSFGIRIDKSFQRNEIETNLFNNINILNTLDDKNKSAIKYIYYFMYIRGKERHCIRPGVEFSIDLLFSKDDKRIYEEVFKAFALLTLFGALGARSRRGAGCFTVNSVEGDSFCDCKYSEFFEKYNRISSTKDLKLFIEEEIKKWISNDDYSDEYTTLKGSKIYIFGQEDNWEKALSKIAKPYYEFRTKNESRITETPNFGFPIRHKNGTTMIAGKKRKKDKIIRRASPLIFKVIKTGKNNYFPIIIWLNGRLLPNGYEIMDFNGGNRATEDDSIIEEFINSIDCKKEETSL
ncbi:type III-B CRISPR module RAMP protein Cmr1 [Caloranaerobacter azorensis]|uniref:Type III-B CRISPR module RAMP protein Cmr1 n=1 Tax=Caloranaerobacter azorensis TaxID=116090 RepID=A0A6P1YDB1_9FIRM|nr:type III-B CRISPR module RAMP protein Cmr1 [Caloranaerobacter azorensis]QIB27290.1 type III-B CRISPR module RAMP protein Cmr1 [Caloranaerobacter azorensis]